MNKKFLEKIKKILEEEKILTEEQLATFAKKDIKPKGDWDTLFPDLDGRTEGEMAEDTAKRIEEYEKLLPVEYILEKKLENINLALERIKKGKYGICENCGKKIPKERLEARPEARLCIKCKERG